MFRPEKMCFINVSVIDTYLTQLLDGLVKVGCVHIVDKREVFLEQKIELVGIFEDIELQPIKSSLDKLNERINNVISALSIGVRYLPIFTESIKSKVEIDPFEIAGKVEEELSLIEADVEPILQEIERYQAEIQLLESDSRHLHALEAKGLSIDELRQMRFLNFVFGTIPEEQVYYQRLIESLSSIPSVVLSGEPVQGRRNIIAFSLVSDKEVFSRALEAAYFSDIHIPEKYTGTISEILDSIETEIWEKREAIAELRAELRGLRQKWREKILELRAVVHANQIVTNSMENFVKTDRMYLLSGWVPYKEVNKLQRELGKIPEESISVDISEPFSAEEAEHYRPKVPTKFTHPSFLRPFTELVKTFDIPRYSAIDPTIFVALTFLLMFSVMFADVGHGGVLLVLGLLGAFLPIPWFKPIRSIAGFFAFCGSGSVITGLMFGSVFGKEDIIEPLWFSLEHMEPTHVNKMLKFGVFIGIGMVSLGVILNIAQSFRRKDFKEAFFGQWGLSSLSAYWVAVYLLLTKSEFSWFRVLIIAMLLLPIALRVPISALFNRKKRAIESEHGVGEEEGEGLIESGFQIYEIVMAYLANTLSYIRVAAFDLSHAGLMMATYSLTEELGGSESLLISLPSNIAANIFVMVLEGLIVLIQCVRLEYYEFFSKFFAGEGLEYKPLRLE